MTTDATDELLKQGIAALKEGRKTEARGLLTQVVEQDERNEVAWLWLSGAVDTDEERRLCLKNVLAINPDNEAARRGWEQLLASEDAQPSSTASSPAPGAEPATTSDEQPTRPPAEASAPDVAQHKEREETPQPEKSPRQRAGLITGLGAGLFVIVCVALVGVWWAMSSGRLPFGPAAPIAVGATQASPTTYATLTPAPSRTSPPTWTPLPTDTPAPTWTPRSTHTPRPTDTPLLTWTPTYTTPTSTPQFTLTPSPTVTPTATPTPSFTLAPTWTPAPTSTPAPSGTQLPTWTPFPTSTPAPSPTPPPTWTPIWTPRPTNTPATTTPEPADTPVSSMAPPTACERDACTSDPSTVPVPVPGTAPITANRHTACASDRDGKIEIHVMNTDDSRQTRLTNDEQTRSKTNGGSHYAT